MYPNVGSTVQQDQNAHGKEKRSSIHSTISLRARSVTEFICGVSRGE